MLRFIALSAVLAAALLTMPGCEGESGQAAGDLQSEVDKGRRPEPSTQRAPPGPGQGNAGFQKGEPGQVPAGQQPPPPPPPAPKKP